MNMLKLFVGVVLCSAPMVLGDDSTAQPNPGHMDRSGERGFRHGDGSRMFPRGSGRMVEPPTEQEWTDVSAFMKENSPKRWEIFESLPEASALRERARNMLVVKYRMLAKTKLDDSALYATLVQRVKLEDTIFALVTALRKAKTEAGSNTDSVRKEFRTQVTALVDLGTTERRQRIERLEKSLLAEREKLAADQRHRGEIIEDRMHRFENGNDWPRGEDPRTQRPLPSGEAGPEAGPEESPEMAPRGDTAALR